MRPLLQSKFLIPPVRTDWIRRPRLVARIDAGLREGAQFTLVSAPAGFGKTTLMSAWVWQSERPVAWLSLDESDNDLVRFLSYFIAALQRLDDRIGADVQSALDASAAPHLETMLTMLVNDINASEESFTLALDDYHLITSECVHDALEFLVENLPPPMHLAVVGRVDPPLSLPHLRVGGRMTEIRSEDLRFTPEEAGAFLNDCMGLGLSPEHVRALTRRTEGWIASLHLAALSLKDRKGRDAFISDFSGSHHYVMDYLVDEVLSRLSEETRNFLCQTSILQRLCAPLCDATLRISNSRQVLERIEGANLFLIPLDDERRWFRYHHLFADFLRQCLRDDQPGAVPELHRRAARWYEENAFTPEAIHHALQAEDFDHAIRMVEQVGFAHLTRSEFARVSAWIEAIPREIVRRRPWLCIFEAWMLRRAGRLDAVERLVRRAERALELPSGAPDPDDRRLIQAHLSSLRAYLALSAGRAGRAIEFAHLAIADFPPDDLIRPVTDSVLGLAYRQRGDLDAAIQAFDRCQRLSLANGNVFLSHIAAWHKGYTQTLGGRLSASLATYQEASQRALHQNHGRALFTGQPHVYIGDILRERNDLDAAIRHLEEGVRLCEPTRLLDALTDGNVALARTRLAQGDLDAALGSFAKARQLLQVPNPEPLNVIHVQDLQIRIWQAEKNSPALARWVGSCGLHEEDDLDFTRELEHINLARALVTLGRADHSEERLARALSLLRRLRILAEEARWNGKLLDILALQAIALHEMGEHSEAIEALQAALALAEPEGYARVFLDEGQPMAALLRRTLQDRPRHKYARILLPLFEMELGRGSCAYAPPLVEALSERELEVLGMLATELSGPEIAHQMMIALSTVRYHTQNIYAKLAVHNRRAAIRRAQELELI